MSQYHDERQRAGTVCLAFLRYYRCFRELYASGVGLWQIPGEGS